MVGCVSRRLPFVIDWLHGLKDIPLDSMALSPSTVYVLAIEEEVEE